MSGAYLIERPLWNEFVETVKREAARYHFVRVTHTGPWPPYDFVRMQFGS